MLYTMVLYVFKTEHAKWTFLTLENRTSGKKTLKIHEIQPAAVKSGRAVPLFENFEKNLDKPSSFDRSELDLWAGQSVQFWPQAYKNPWPLGVKELYMEISDKKYTSELMRAYKTLKSSVFN